MSVRGSVLVVDDEDYVRLSLGEVFQSEGWRVLSASSSREAAEHLGARRFDLVVTDLRMPSGDAFHLLEHVRALLEGPPVIVITGVGTVSEAVRAMKQGAFDFLQKPIDPEELLLTAARAVEHGRLVREVSSLRSRLAGLRAPRELVGVSESLQRLRDSIAQVAPTDSPVLVTGETGTGKGLIAELIHAASAAAAGPCRWVRCSTLDGSALEGRAGPRPGGILSEAEGGSLVLDELESLPQDQQAGLLHGLHRLLGDSASRDPRSSASARVIAIANEKLAALVQSGAFRADLYWRLNVFPIVVPPLREHLEDVPALVEHFLDWARSQRATGTADAASLAPTADALDLLASYWWPGNVRELRNVLERAVIVGGDGALDAELLRGILEPALAGSLEAGPQELHLRRNLDAAERELLLRALAQSQGLKKKAAYLLGIDARNLGYYLRKHGLTEPRGREESS